jgi:hypothetical protein
MKPRYRPLTVLLTVLGIGDLALVPFMIAANHHTAGTPPVPAIAVAALIGVVTLMSAAGLTQGRTWAFRVAMTCRILDAISAILGVTNRPSTLLTITGAIWLVLSVVAIVLLVRLSPRRAPRGTVSGPAAARQPERSGGPAR